MKKKLLVTVVLSMVMMFAFSSMAMASDEAVVDNVEEPITGILVQNGVITQMTKSEVDAFLIESERHNEEVLQMENRLLQENVNTNIEESEIEGDKNNNLRATYLYDYTQTSSSSFYGTPKAVSAWMVVPSKGGSIKTSSSVTTMRTFSVGLSTGEMDFISNYVKANVNMSVSKSSTSLVGYTMNGTPGFTQRIMFKPILERSSGVLKTTLIGGHSGNTTVNNVTSEHPVINGNLADGVYYLESK